jgi:hypothetical protein
MPSMISELASFAQIGFRHVASIDALDHILFLLALAAIYRLRDWRSALWVVTAFTVGHSVTLALSATDVLRLPAELIEFLIPITIVATAVDNILRRDRVGAWGARYRAVFAGVFGLVHGAGFANYLRSLFVDRVAVPLLGFNVGIELGQIAILGAATALLTAIDSVLSRRSSDGAMRLRVVAVSAMIAVVAGRWAMERAPW